MQFAPKNEEKLFPLNDEQLKVFYVYLFYA